MADDGIQRIRFDGKFAADLAADSEFMVAASFQENDFTSLDLEMFWQGNRDERRHSLHVLESNQMDCIWIYNCNPSSGHLEILGIRGHSTNFSETRLISTQIHFSALQRGIHRDIEAEDRPVHLNIVFVPSGLFFGGIKGLHYTGEIKVNPLDAPPILLKSKFGELLFSQTYGYETVTEHGNEVTKQIPRSTISGNIVIPKGASLYDVHETIRAEIELIRIALSFCFRQSIGCVNIVYSEVKNGQSRIAYYRRKLSETKLKLQGEPLFSSRNMGDGRLQKLVENIQNFSDSEDLRRAIDFLATSYESPLETAFFMTFSAMETIVNLSIGSASAAAYNTTEWSKIRTALKEAIDRISVELSIEGANLLEKLPEMERPSFKKRVTLACSTLSPKTSDIWPDGDFIKGMQGAARLRNGLFHAAKYSDHNAIADSLIRIRTFTERLLTKLLKVADEDLWPHRDNELRRLNSSRLSM